MNSNGPSLKYFSRLGPLFAFAFFREAVRRFQRLSGCASAPFFICPPESIIQVMRRTCRNMKTVRVRSVIIFSLCPDKRTQQTEVLMEDQGKTRIRLYTDQFMIVGEIAMFPDTRLTDYIVGAHDFIAVTDAVVQTREEKVLFSADFLNVQKNKIVFIVPEAMVKPE
jgi:hypothetical protein